MTELHGERLAFALFLAAVLHALLILGLGFERPKAPAASAPPVLDLRLMPRPDLSPPPDADFIAQASREGGGEGGAAQSRPEQGSASAAPPALASAPPEMPVPAAAVAPAAPADAGERPPEVAVPPPVESGSQSLAEQALEQARLEFRLEQRAEAMARQPRERTVTASTRYGVEAAYVARWEDRVQRVGSVFYPAEARRAGVSGRLLLKVSLNARGEVLAAEVLRSSGYATLDESAVQIVQKAAPFPPFDADLMSQLDRLHIVRTWVFDAGTRSVVTE